MNTGIVEYPRLQTRLTRQFGLQTPLALAPMAPASGGALAAACARAGTLGLVGGGYGDLAWTQEQYTLALEGTGASVAQGGEAGGHGMNALNNRATITFVPELADWLTVHAPDTLLLAAGGIADGRTLAAALVLGADGALVGSRLWATAESLAAQGAKDLALATTGDGTARSSVFDILRQKNWPEPYDFRAIRNDLHRQWETRQDALRADPAAARADYDEGVKAGDFSRAQATVGEAVGLIGNLAPAAEVIARMSADAVEVFEEKQRLSQ